MRGNKQRKKIREIRDGRKGGSILRKGIRKGRKEGRKQIKEANKERE